MSIFSVVAKYSSTGAKYLDSNKGDFVCVLKESGSGWAYCCNSSGKKGVHEHMFSLALSNCLIGFLPKKYLKPISSFDDALEVKEENSPKMFLENKPRSLGLVGEECEAEFVDEKSSSCCASCKSAKMKVGKLVESESCLDCGGSDYAVVIADYDGKMQDKRCLTIKSRDIVKILEKGGDWWRCELNGEKGLCPSNLLKTEKEVELLTRKYAHRKRNWANRIAEGKRHAAKARKPRHAKDQKLPTEGFCASYHSDEHNTSAPAGLTFSSTSVPLRASKSEIAFQAPSSTDTTQSKKGDAGILREQSVTAGAAECTQGRAPCLPQSEISNAETPICSLPSKAPCEKPNICAIPNASAKSDGCSDASAEPNQTSKLKWQYQQVEKAQTKEQWPQQQQQQQQQQTQQFCLCRPAVPMQAQHFQLQTSRGYNTCNAFNASRSFNTFNTHNACNSYNPFNTFSYPNMRSTCNAHKTCPTFSSCKPDSSAASCRPQTARTSSIQQNTASASSASLFYYRPRSTNASISSSSSPSLSSPSASPQAFSAPFKVPTKTPSPASPSSTTLTPSSPSSSSSSLSTISYPVNFPSPVPDAKINLLSPSPLPLHPSFPSLPSLPLLPPCYLALNKQDKQAVNSVQMPVATQQCADCIEKLNDCNQTSSSQSLLPSSIDTIEQPTTTSTPTSSHMPFDKHQKKHQKKHQHQHKHEHKQKCKQHRQHLLEQNLPTDHTQMPVASLSEWKESKEGIEEARKAEEEHKKREKKTAELRTMERPVKSDLSHPSRELQTEQLNAPSSTTSSSSSSSSSTLNSTASSSPKVCVVTGGAGGIGRCCVTKLLKEGLVVIAMDVSEEEGREMVQKMAEGEEEEEEVKKDINLISIQQQKSNEKPSIQRKHFSITQFEGHSVFAFPPITEITSSSSSTLSSSLLSQRQLIYFAGNPSDESDLNVFVLFVRSTGFAVRSLITAPSVCLDWWNKKEDCASGRKEGKRKGKGRRKGKEERKSNKKVESNEVDSPSSSSQQPTATEAKAKATMPSLFSSSSSSSSSSSFSLFRQMLSECVISPSVLVSSLSDRFSLGASVVFISSPLNCSSSFSSLPSTPSPSSASSSSSLFPPSSDAICVQRGSLDCLTRRLSAVYLGVARVNAIHPGWIDTKKDILENGRREEAKMCECKGSGRDGDGGGDDDEDDGIDCSLPVFCSLEDSTEGVETTKASAKSSAGCSFSADKSTFLNSSPCLRTPNMTPNSFSALSSPASSFSLPTHPLLAPLCFNRQISEPQRGRCEDAANLAVFLCSDEASFISGQCISVDGGFGSSY